MKSKNMKNKKIQLLFLYLAFSMLFFSSEITSAKENSSVVVHPLKENIAITKGKSVKKSLLIVNSSNKSLTFKVSVNDFRIIDEKGKVQFYEEEGSYPAKKWLIPQYSIITVGELDSKKMEYIVATDKDMPSKGYAGAIIFQHYDVKDKKIIGEPFGTLIMLNVLGKGISTGGTINSFTSSFLQFKDPINLSFTVKNPSNSNLSLTGDVVFTTVFGKEVARFKTGQLDIYPGASRNFKFQWSDSNIFGAYLASVNLVNGLREDNIISSWTLLMFIPWQKLVLGLIITVLAIFLIVFLYRRYSSKILAGYLAQKNLQPHNNNFIGNTIFTVIYFKEQLAKYLLKVKNLQILKKH
mgnify:FL=1